MSWIEPTKKPPVNKEVLGQKEGKHFVCQFDGEHWLDKDQIMVDAPTGWKFIEEQFEQGQIVWIPIVNINTNGIEYERKDEDGTIVVKNNDGNLAKALAAFKTRKEATDAVNEAIKIVTEFFQGK